jgi:hypothetical protein
MSVSGRCGGTGLDIGDGPLGMNFAAVVRRDSISLAGVAN